MATEFAGGFDFTPDEVRGYLTSAMPELHLEGSERRGDCPVAGCTGHRGREPFTISAETGQWTCHKCQARGNLIQLEQVLGNHETRGRAYRHLCELVGRTTMSAPARRVSRKSLVVGAGRTEPDAPAKPQHHLVVWDEAGIGEGAAGIVEAYARHRGLKTAYGFGDEIRAHLGLPYYDGKRSGPARILKALVARVRAADGTVQGVQRIYLQPTTEGLFKKADVPAPKKMLGAKRGGAIRLVEPTGGILALSEGMETAWAIIEATRTATWAAIDASNLADTVEIPEGISRLEIWADRDPKGTGQEAAYNAAERLARPGREVYLIIPPREGQDWLDVLRDEGPDALRAAQQGASPLTPRQVTTRDLGVISHAEFNAIELNPPTFIVDSLIPVGVTLLAAASKVGKTYFALDVAAAVASGGLALGRFQATEGRVLYINIDEPNEGAFRARLNFRRAGTEVADVPLNGPSERYQNPDNLTWLELVLKFAQPRYTLVVIDTWEKWRAPMERISDNAYQKDTAAISPLNELAARHGVAVLLVHHTNKTRLSKDEDPFLAISGSNGLVASSAQGLILRRDHESKEAFLYARGRYSEELHLAMAFNGDLARGGGEPRDFWLANGEAAEVATGKAEQAILKALPSTGEAVTISEIQYELPGMDTEYSQAYIQKILKQLRMKGLVERRNNKWWIRHPAGTAGTPGTFGASGTPGTFGTSGTPGTFGTSGAPSTSTTIATQRPDPMEGTTEVPPGYLWGESLEGFTGQGFVASDGREGTKGTEGTPGTLSVPDPTRETVYDDDSD